MEEEEEEEEEDEDEGEVGSISSSDECRGQNDDNDRVT